MTEEFQRKFTRDLPVTLTNAEQTAYGKMLADKTHARELALEAKKQETARRGVVIKAIDNEIKRLTEVTMRGEELRGVICGERLHGNVIEIVRLDRFEVVESRPAELQDLQSTFSGPGFGDEVVDDGSSTPMDTPDNVIPFTGTTTTTNTGDQVHVGDPDDRDEATEAQFGSAEEVAAGEEPAAESTLPEYEGEIPDDETASPEPEAEPEDTKTLAPKSVKRIRDRSAKRSPSKKKK